MCANTTDLRQISPNTICVRTESYKRLSVYFGEKFRRRPLSCVSRIDKQTVTVRVVGKEYYYTWNESLHPLRSDRLTVRWLEQRNGRLELPLLNVSKCQSVRLPSTRSKREYQANQANLSANFIKHLQLVSRTIIFLQPTYDRVQSSAPGAASSILFWLAVITFLF